MSAIYLSSGFSRRFFLRAAAKSLEAKGHTIVSRWIDLETRPDENDSYRDHFMEKVGKDNIYDLQRADILVCDLDGVRSDGNGGAHIEFGFFLATWKPIFLIGKRTNSFHWLPQVNSVLNWSDLFDKLEGL